MIDNYSVDDLCQLEYDEINTVSSIIFLLKEYCSNLECKKQYYYGKNITHSISNERNRYITLLSLAEEHVSKIEEINLALENKLA